jgi:hypothetical protein
MFKNMRSHASIPLYVCVTWCLIKLTVTLVCIFLLQRRCEEQCSDDSVDERLQSHVEQVKGGSISNQRYFE